MPEPLWIYRMALRYLTTVTPCSARADACDSVSPAHLPHLLQGTGSGHTLVNLALRLVCTVAGGSLSVADPVVAKPYARRLGEAAWVGSHKARQGLLGVSVLLLVWTDGQSRLPLAFRVWHQGGAAKDALARELLS
jgi:hypothetical protein